MKMKRVAALLLAGVMSLSLVACGGNNKANNAATNDTANTAETEDTADTAETEDAADAEGEATEETAALEGKLVIWTQAADLEKFAAKFTEENPGVEIETVVIDPAEYVTKVQAALNSGQTTPDIIVGEPQMLEGFYEAQYFEDLNQAPYNAQDYAGQIVDYVWQVGQDSEGIQRAISYQITPAGIYYRRDIATEVFGTDDPAEVGKLFADYNTIRETAKTLKDAGYRIFASDAEIGYFAGDTAWVVDGALNVDQARIDYMDLCVDLWNNDYTAYANQWSTPWYQAMGGEIPAFDEADTVNVWDAEEFAAATEGMDTTSVFAFGLPSWGVISMSPNYGDTTGKWGVCSGPAYGFGGGTFIGISALSENKDLAWNFLKWATLTETTADWWVGESGGDVVSLVSVIEKHAEDANETYGGQQLYKFWLEQAEGIDYSKVTRYDDFIDDAWGAAITAIKTGEKTKEEAISAFYDEVEATYAGEITVNRE